jgi:hypothetical protein
MKFNSVKVLAIRAAIPVGALALIACGVWCMWGGAWAMIALGGLVWVDLLIPRRREE